MALTDRISALTTRIATEFKSVRDALAGKVSGTGVATIRVLTQAEYDALAVKDETTLYVIKA